MGALREELSVLYRTLRDDFDIVSEATSTVAALNVKNVSDIASTPHVFATNP